MRGIQVISISYNSTQNILIFIGVFKVHTTRMSVLPSWRNVSKNIIVGWVAGPSSRNYFNL